MVIFQKIIKNEDLRRSYASGLPILYVFGDNVKRVGMGGQAGEMRYEPNAVGVATLYAPGVFYRDDAVSVDAQKRIIDRDMKRLFDHVKQGGIVVWPADGIGTGLARLPKASPTTFTYLEEKLEALVKVGRAFNEDRKGVEILKDAAPE